MKYKDFFAELFCEGCDCDQQAEEYPYGGYKVTQRDIEADEKTAFFTDEETVDIQELYKKLFTI